MAIKVGTAQDAADKLVRVTSQRQDDYAAGVKNPRRDWAQNTADASETWNQAVQDAAARGSFKKGVAAAGNEAWQTGAVEKGTGRWAPGVRAGQQKYATAMQKNLDTISRVNLPPRRPRGDASNIDRVRAVNDALAAQRRGK